MSIGYRKEGFDTHINISTGVTAAYGLVPVSKHLLPGFSYFRADPNTTYLSFVDVDVSTLSPGGPAITVDFYVKDTKICTGKFTRSGNGGTVWYEAFDKAGTGSFLFTNIFRIYFCYIEYKGFYYLLNNVNNNNIEVNESVINYFPKTNQAPTVVEGFPYGDGESTSQGGQGEMTDTSDPIEIDSKPLLTTGEFLRVYKMTATNLTALRDKLISNGFLDNLIAKLRTDAMDYIVGLNAIPYASTSTADSTIKIANLDTEISASYLTWYIEDFDFGEIELKEYFQTFMDYSPYTKLSAYIPYCGIVPLNVDDFMNDKISMKCRVDMLTGQFVVFVSNSVGVVTTVSGNCAYQLPIRANDYNRLVTSGLGLLGGIVGTAGALATGNVPLAIGAGLGTTGALVATSQAMTKPDVTSKGSLGGNYGLLGNRTPYLIIQRPTISVPSDYGKTIGYMSRITAKLGDLTGYTVVEEIHLEHISATDDEKKLIENALKSGVIL